MPLPKQTVPAYPPLVKYLFLGYSLGFLVGTYTHVADLLRHGLLAAPVPLAIGIFWNALTLLDPLAVSLLWWRPRAGIGLAVSIMLVDVGVNTGVYLAGYFGPPTPYMVPLTLFDQALFGLFVLLTAPVAYRRLFPPAKPANQVLFALSPTTNLPPAR